MLSLRCNCFGRTGQGQKSSQSVNIRPLIQVLFIELRCPWWRPISCSSPCLARTSDLSGGNSVCLSTNCLTSTRPCIACRSGLGRSSSKTCASYRSENTNGRFGLLNVHESSLRRTTRKKNIAVRTRHLSPRLAVSWTRLNRWRNFLLYYNIFIIIFFIVREDEEEVELKRRAPGRRRRWWGGMGFVRHTPERRLERSVDCACIRLITTPVKPFDDVSPCAMWTIDMSVLTETVYLRRPVRSRFYFQHARQSHREYRHMGISEFV